MSEDLKKAASACDNWRLGQTSARYESSGRGAGVISTGRGDRGGVSYGAYQLSSKEGTVQEYLADSRYGIHFKGLRPATPAFDAKWREIARTDPGFAEDQHEFIGRTHYSEQVERLQRQGLDLSGRGRAVQDALWSTSVQFRGLTPRIVEGGLKERFGERYDLSRISDRQIVEAIQDHKITHNNSLFRSSPVLWPGLLSRARSEKSALIELAQCENLLKESLELVQNSSAVGLINGMPGAFDKPELGSRQACSTSVLFVESDPSQESLLKLGDCSSGVERLQQRLVQLGYSANGAVPLKADGIFGPDTREVVRAFQRDHNLKDDGIAGPRTLQALSRADAQLLSSPAHPRHTLYTQALDAVHLVEVNRCIATGAHSERLASALTVEAVRDGLVRIDRVELNAQGTLARAVQVHPMRDEATLNRVTDGIDTQQAMQRSVRESSELMQQAMPERRAHEEPQRQQSQPRALAL